jgi:hypothetical protein
LQFVPFGTDIARRLPYELIVIHAVHATVDPNGRVQPDVPGKPAGSIRIAAPGEKMKRDYPALLQPAPPSGQPAARHALVASLFRMGARCLRVVAKARAGDYRARAPVSRVAWLERHAAEKAAE